MSAAYFVPGESAEARRNKLNQLVANGYFKGYYLTSAALISAIPAGATGWAAYVSATKTLWQWNGSAWVDSGVGSLDTSFADTLFQLYSNADSTSKLTFDLSGMATATTRDVTPPAQDGQLLVKEDVIDEDDLSSDSAVYPPSQQSVKKFVEDGVQIGVHAYATSDQAISVATITKVLFGTERYDVGGNFATSTFTAPVAGRYLIIPNVRFATGAAGNDLSLYVYINGAHVVDSQIDAGGGSDNTVNMPVTLDLSASDTVDIYARNQQATDTIRATDSFMCVEYMGT